MKMIINMFVIIGIIISSSCNEEKHFPYEEGLAIEGKISNVEIVPIAGGAVLTYSLPADQSLSHVLAVVNMPNGLKREFASSKYINSIEINGLAKEQPHKVSIYAVSRGGVKSDPFEIYFTPLTPPYLQVFETLTLTADFGGVNIKWLNESEANLGVVLLANDSLGNFSQYNSIYSKAKELNHSFRGMKTEENHFGVFVKDRWGNTSDTLYKTLLPLHENLLDRSKFQKVELPGDAILYPLSEPTVRFEFLWDNIFMRTWTEGWTYKTMTTNDTRDFPLHITMDLGVTAKLTRMRLHHYYKFENRAIKAFEVWGHPGPPPADGSWDGWVKLGEYEQFKPSGITTPGSGASVVTEADKKFWEEGDNLNLDSEPSVRYIRIKGLKNWSNSKNMSFAEVMFWGSEI